MQYSLDFNFKIEAIEENTPYNFYSGESSPGDELADV